MSTTTNTPTPTDPNQTELWLNERFAKYTYDPARSIDDINEKMSLENQARFVPVDQTLVLQYRQALKKGAVFPAITVLDTPNGLMNIDGNHRYLSHLAEKRETMAMYILDIQTAPELVQVLSFEANSRLNGKTNSEEEKVHHGIWLVNNGATQDTAASIVGISKTVLGRHLGIAKGQQRAIELSVDKEWKKLSNEAKFRVNAISGNPVFAEAVTLIAQGNLNNAELKELVAGVRKLRSEAEQIQMIKDQHDALRGQIQERGAGVLKRGVKSPRHGMMMHLGFVLAQNQDEIMAGVQDDKQRDDLLTKCYEAMLFLDSLSDRLAPKKS